MPFDEDSEEFRRAVEFGDRHRARFYPGFLAMLLLLLLPKRARRRPIARVERWMWGQRITED